MRLRFTERADKDYADLPANIRKAFAKQLRFLLANLRHPSLHTKKYSEGEDIWQGRVTRGWRFYFKIEADEYIILSIVPHP
ncbi:MAG: type II toxin-antitoxin system RelE/ParE family toxin [Terriglobia bacterium]